MSENSEELVLQALSTEAFILINKKFMRFFKGDATVALFLSELISSYRYALKAHAIEPDGAFPIPTKRYEQGLYLSNYKQDRALEVMTGKMLIDVRLMGFPAMKYVKLNFDNIAYVLAHDEMKIKKLDQAEFYAGINQEANKLESYSSNLGSLISALDNIQDTLKGIIILISKRNVEHKRKVEWTPMLLGQIKNWASRVAKDKNFDFTIVERTMDAMRLLPNTNFHKFIADFMLTSKGVQDAHFLAQVHDFHDLLPPVT